MSNCRLLKSQLEMITLSRGKEYQKMDRFRQTSFTPISFWKISGARPLHFHIQ